MTTTTITGDQTKVSWEMIGKSSYPCNFMNLFMDDMPGKDMKSLTMLKGILEKNKIKDLAPKLRVPGLSPGGC